MALTIDINASCNIDCAFCYQDLDGSRLSQEEILEFAGQSLPVLDNAETIQIGGGEPFLYKGFVDLIRTLRQKGKRVHVSTNATVIPEGLLDLEERMRDGIQIQVSLHAANAALYQHITGKDLFTVVMQNIPLIKERYATVMSAVIYRANVDDVPNLISLAEKLQLPLRVNLVFPEGKGKTVPLLTEQHIDQLKGYLLAQKLRGKNIESPLIHPNMCSAVDQTYDIPKQGLCPVDCGTKRYVTPRGERYACEFFRVGA